MISFRSFCKGHPALMHSIFFLLGLASIKDLNPYFLALATLGLLVLKKKASFFLYSCLICFGLSLFYGHIKKEKFPLNQTSIAGTFAFTPDEIKLHKSHFKQMQLVKGKASLIGGDRSVKNIPCSILLSAKDPKIHSSFYIHGSLEKKGSSSPFFSLKPDGKQDWIPIPYSFSLAQLRFEAKKHLSLKIKSTFSNEKVSDVIEALVLGNVEDRMLKFDFARLGIQHVLAISGFHFGLLACILGLFFRLLLKEKWAYLSLFSCLTLYFILLGSSPSILRAYLVISLYLLSKLSSLPSKALNLLGVALFLEMLLAPSVISHLGFQLSFLATFSILFLLPLTKEWTGHFFPKRDEEKLLTFSLLDRWMYLFCCFLRSAFALNLAVSLTTIPVCLFYFHKFPWMSLAYNLFIPLFFSLSLFLFFVSLPFSFLAPPLFSALSFCNEKFTELALKCTSQSPICLDLYLYTSFPLPLLLLFLLSIFSLRFISIPSCFDALKKSNKSMRG